MWDLNSLSLRFLNGKTCLVKSSFQGWLCEVPSVAPAQGSVFSPHPHQVGRCLCGGTVSLVPIFGLVRWCQTHSSSVSTTTCHVLFPRELSFPFNAPKTRPEGAGRQQPISWSPSCHSMWKYVFVRADLSAHMCAPSHSIFEGLNIPERRGSNKSSCARILHLSCSPLKTRWPLTQCE